MPRGHHLLRQHTTLHAFLSCTHTHRPVLIPGSIRRGQETPVSVSSVNTPRHLWALVQFLHLLCTGVLRTLLRAVMRMEPGVSQIGRGHWRVKNGRGTGNYNRTASKSNLIAVLKLPASAATTVMVWQREVTQTCGTPLQLWLSHPSLSHHKAEEENLCSCI
jgi:hypothetical protein